MNAILKCAIAIFIGVISFNTLLSQISTEEKPISFNYDGNMFKTSNENLKTMPSLDFKKLKIEDEEDAKNNIPPRFGYPHKVDFNLENSGQWFTMPNGDKLWKLEIYCPDALSINLLYDKFWLPGGAKFFIYACHKKHTIGAFTSINNKKSTKEIPQGFATELIYGDKIILEYYLPKNITEQGIISICNIVQGYRYINIIDGYNNNKNKKVENAFQEFGGAFGCEVNINCSPEGDNYQKEKNAVALILIDGLRLCTGSLINNTRNDYEPLFLTSFNRFITKDAKGDNNLSYWIFYWHYESNGCTNPIMEPTWKSTHGAVVVSNDATSNGTYFALLRLTDDPTYKQGVTPYYLGWDKSGSNVTDGVCIHHPMGDIKKIAVFNAVTSNGTDWITYWTTSHNGRAFVWGAGSSYGSPLLNLSKRFIGMPYLSSAGVNPCGPISSIIGCYSAYKKISNMWLNNTTDHQRRLKEWLDPLNTGTNTLSGLEGIDPCTSDKTLSGTLSSQTIMNNNVLIQNVTINSGVIVKIKACNNITIGSGVTVKSGGTLEIKAGGSVSYYSNITIESGANFINH